MIKWTLVALVLVLLSACSLSGPTYKHRMLKSGTVISTDPAVLGDKMVKQAIQFDKQNPSKKSALNVPRGVGIPIFILDPPELGFGPDDNPFTREDIKHPLEDFDVCWVKYEDSVDTDVADGTQSELISCLAPGTGFRVKYPFVARRD